MTQEQFGSLLEQLKAYKQNLDFSDREKEEYMDIIINHVENNENLYVNATTTLEDVFDELREQQDWSDGGYQEDMFSDVNEDDEEYPDDYDPRANEEYSIHSMLLDELQDYLGC